MNAMRKRKNRFLNVTAITPFVFFALCCITAEAQDNSSKIAVLVTDWGSPDGFDAQYYSQIGYRGSRGPAADPNIPPEEQSCLETYVGIWPYLSAMGIMPHAVSYDSDINDTSGIYRHTDNDTYVNLLEPSCYLNFKSAQF